MPWNVIRARGGSAAGGSAPAVWQEGLSMLERTFVNRLRDRDLGAFRTLVERYHASLVRLARIFCASRATAEEVVQEAWIVAFTRFDGYSGAGSLKAWLSGIVVNKAKSRAVLDRRVVSFSDLARSEAQDGNGGLDRRRFGADGRWTDPPAPWDAMTPEREVEGRQLIVHLGSMIDALPPAQRAALLLRDVEQQEPEEICRLLQISPGNLRVLLHRARTRLRAQVEALAAPARPDSAARAQGPEPVVSRRPAVM